MSRRLFSHNLTPREVEELLDPPGEEIIQLPDSATLVELWRVLGFAESPSSTPLYPDFAVEGVYRRLRAGLNSIHTRGFATDSVEVVGDHLTWTSTGGCWSPRPWVIKTKIGFDNNTVTCSDTAVTIGSREGTDETTFVDGPLDKIIEGRLNWVIAIIGARCKKPNDVLTDEEIDQQSDLHSSPCKAWRFGGARVVLEDDDHGSAYLKVEGGEKVKLMLDSLRREGWRYTTRYTRYTTSTEGKVTAQ